VEPAVVCKAGVFCLARWMGFAVVFRMRRTCLSVQASSRRRRGVTGVVDEDVNSIALGNCTGGQLARLEKLEALALGIEGKRALWRALLAVAEEIPALRNVDLVRLDQRADDQRTRVEVRRIEAAREAFVPAKSDD
jgi:hypothetical protein